MTTPKESNTSKRASADVGRYFTLAERFCQKKFGGTEGKETLLAATVIALAIREAAGELSDSISSSTDGLESIVGELSQLDISVGAIASGLEEVGNSVLAVADRIS